MTKELSTSELEVMEDSYKYKDWKRLFNWSTNDNGNKLFATIRNNPEL